MANIKLTGNTWDTSSVYDDAQGKTQKQINAKAATNDGYFEDMTVGTAEQLLSSNYTEDKVPYSFRQTGGGVDVGKRAEEMIVGGTVAWNQQLVNGNFTNTGSWGKIESTITVQDNIVTITKVSKNPSLLYQVIPFNDHVYFASAELKGADAYISFVRAENGNELDSKAYTTSNDSFTRVCFLGKRTNADANRFVIRDSQSDPGSVYYAKNVCLFDVTQMFGSTIADYIASLETANAGAGVAYLRSLFPSPYYAYNSGALMSVNTASHNMVGFNVWDEVWEAGGISGTDGTNIDNAQSADRLRSKNYIRVKPGTNYYITYTGAITGYSFYLVAYDKHKNFLYRESRGANVQKFMEWNVEYIRFFVYKDGTSFLPYNNDICINIFDSSKNGTYEPYDGHIYPLDSTLTLCGIPKLDSNNKLYYDGDTYESDGKVTRKYGILNVGEQTFSTSNALSDNRVVYYFRTTAIGMYMGSAMSLDAPFCICSKNFDQIYENKSGYGVNTMLAFPAASTLNVPANSFGFVVSTTDYASAAAFKTAMSGVYLVYELATPTTESAASYTSPQICDPNGTEEYVDAGVVESTRDVSIPVGHETKYGEDLVGKLEALPPIPDAPTTNGIYNLRVVVSGGEPTYSWVSV